MTHLARRVLRALPPLCALLAATFLMAAGTTPSSAPANPSGFVIARGTNLSHWLSQDFGWMPRETWITENDIRYIACLGFDHVRLPIDEKELWHEDGRQNDGAFALLLEAIDWCQSSNLRVIVDLHTVRSHHFNAANDGTTNTLWSDRGAQESFIDLWRQLSARLRHLPVDAVAYEIMNEPVADDHEDWNRLVAATMKVIRASERDRVVVIGSNRWQIPSIMPFLKVPEGDRNIILSMHTYSPLAFTHYLAGWTPLKGYTGPVHYPGPVVDRNLFEKQLPGNDAFIAEMANNASEDWGPARLLKELEPAVTRARELGLQLYCGEFGCMPTVPRADRFAYYRDIVGNFEASGMAWANWEYKGHFGILEWNGPGKPTGAPDVAFINALFMK